MLILGDYAFSFFKETKEIESFDIMCYEAQLPLLLEEFNLTTFQRFNRFSATGEKNKINYNFYIANDSIPMRAMLEKNNAEGNNFVVANYETQYAMYKEMSFYRTMTFYKWEKYFKRSKELKENFVSKVFGPRERNNIELLSLQQRHWIKLLASSEKEYQFRGQELYDINDMLIEFSKDYDIYEQILSPEGEIFSDTFFLLHESDKKIFIYDMLAIDVMTQYVIPNEFLGKKRNMEKFLKFCWKKVLMYSLTRDITSYFRNYLEDNYEEIIEMYNNNFYLKIKEAIKKNELLEI